MADLFETPELIPLNIQNILDTFDEDKCGYAELKQILAEVETIGYTFDYGLDSIPYDLQVKGVRNMR